MMDFEVFFPTPLTEIDVPTNANIDVCIRLKDGKTYTLVFITPDNLKFLMASNNEYYIHPSFKFVVVDKIEESRIISALSEIVKDANLLQILGDD
jgi:hypothetical protein